MDLKPVVVCMLILLGLAFAGNARSDEVQPDKRMAALSESLQDPDPAVRQAAARSLGDTKDKSAVPALSVVLANDMDESVRVVALGALITIGDCSALPAYTKALKDESEKVRRSAAEALAGVWDETAHDALIGALKSDLSPNVRRCAALALGNPGIMGRYRGHKWDESADTAGALMDALKHDESYGVRATAATVLSRYNVDNVVDALLDALHDKNPAVRAAAAESFGTTEKSKVVVDRLLDVLYFEKDESVLLCALKALEFTDDPRLVDPVLKALGSASAKVRWQAIDVIEVLRPRSAIAPLTDIADDEHESAGIRNKAGEALDLIKAAE